MTLDLVADLAKMRTPLNSADSRDLLRRLTETEPEVRLMRELCEGVASELVRKFAAVRDSCMKRFSRDSEGLGGEA